MEYVLALDLGGTNIRTAIIDENFKIHHVLKEPSLKNDASKLCDQIIRMLSSLPYKDYPIKAIGVSTCGFVLDGKVLQLFNLGIEELPLKERLSKIFYNIPIFVVNDANAAALYEANNIKRKGEDVFFITVSTGIGGGLVYQGQLIDLPLEIGHLKMEYKNKIYDAEHLLSGNGIPLLAKLNGLEVDNASSFFAKIDKDDKKAKEILEIYTDLFALYMCNIHLLFNVDTYVFSGGMMKSEVYFLNKMKEKLEKYLLPYPLKKIHIVLAEHDQDAGLIGAASVGFYMN